MISEQMAKKLNEQLNIEFFAFYQYLAMSAYCQSVSLNGFAHWFSLQAEEERGHAMKIYQYLIDQDRDVKLAALGEPKNTFASVVEVMEKALAHEQHVTQSINDVVAAAHQDNDYATIAFMQWFVTEQVEEEAAVRDILESLQLVDNKNGLFILDRELKERQPESE